MNCHGNNKKSNKNCTLKHILHLILYFELPMIIIGFLPLTSKVSPGFSRILEIIAPFICPIMMIGMFVTIIGSNRKESCCSVKNDKFKSDSIIKSK